MTHYERVDGMRVNKADMISDMMSDEQAWKDFEEFYDRTFTASEVLLMFCDGHEEFAEWVESMIEHSLRDLVMYGYRRVNGSQNRKSSDGCKTKTSGKPGASNNRRPKKGTGSRSSGKKKSGTRRRRDGQTEDRRT